MRSAMVGISLFILVGTLGAASPEAPAPDPSLPLASFRVETGEVHIQLSAFDSHSVPVSNLRPDELQIRRDGVAVGGIVDLRRHQQLPMIATVLTDTSESMGKSVAMAREGWSWLTSRVIRSDDRVDLLEFDEAVSPAGARKTSRAHLTSFYDALVQLIPEIRKNETGRRALILFTDGKDTASYHTLQDVIDVASREDVVIYAITPDIDSVTFDAEVLQQLTASTGGRAFKVADVEQMIFAGKMIEQDLREGYELILHSDKRPGGARTLAIAAPGKSLRLYYKQRYYQPSVRPTTVQMAAR